MTKVTCVGNITADIIALVQAFFGDTKNETLTIPGVFLGGASANIMFSFKTMEKLYGVNENKNNVSKIITDIGEPPREKSYPLYNQYLLATSSYNWVQDLLRRENIDYVDISAGLNGNGVNASTVQNYQRGRNISKWKRPPLPIPDFSIAAGFISKLFAKKVNGRNLEGSAGGVSKMLEKEIKGSDLVFLDPSSPMLSYMAACICKDLGIKTITDYGAKKVGTGEKDKYVRKILDMSDIIIVPGDAVVHGMENEKKNPKKLFTILKGRYPYKTTIMSDGSVPVNIFHNGREMDEIELPQVDEEKAINVSGAGDTRDGAFMFYMTRGDDEYTALRKASVVASIRIQYPNNEWTKHFLDHVREDPLFKDDVEFLEAAVKQQDVKDAMKVEENVPA